MLPTEAKIIVETAQQIWAEVRAEVPQGTDRLKHGSLAICGYWKGYFTQAQLDEFNRRTQRIMRAARKAHKAAA